MKKSYKTDNRGSAILRCASALLLAGGMLLSSVASAEVTGAANGRTADLTRMPDLSLDLHFNTGDDYQNIGLRVNYRLSPGIILFGDIGQGEFDPLSGTPIGFGVFYGLEGIFENIDAAAKVSYHLGDYDGLDVNVLALEFLISGLEPIASNGLMWYANAGIHRLDFDASGFGSSSDTELGFGGGVVLPVSNGEAFAGIDIIDETLFGIGYRYFFQ